MDHSKPSFKGRQWLKKLEIPSIITKLYNERVVYVPAALDVWLPGSSGGLPVPPGAGPCQDGGILGTVQARSGVRESLKQKTSCENISL